MLAEVILQIIVKDDFTGSLLVLPLFLDNERGFVK